MIQVRTLSLGHQITFLDAIRFMFELILYSYDRLIRFLLNNGIS